MAAAMSGSVSPRPSSPMGLNDLIICPVCLDSFKDPKTLACLHSFCTSCLENCRRPYRRDICCPVCKKITPLPPLGIQGLQNDFRIQQIKDILLTKANNGASGDSRLMAVEESKLCDLCKSQQRQGSANAHCIQCYMYFCTACLHKHNANPLFASHHVINMTEENSMDALFCRTHKEHPVRYFCKPCGLMLCTICTMEHSSEHTPEPLEKSIIEKYKMELQNSLHTIKSRLSEVKSKTKYLETLKQSHQRALYDAQESIRKRADDIIGGIREQEKQLLDEVQRVMDEKMKEQGIHILGEIRFQKSTMEALYSEIKDVIQGSPQQCLIAYEDIKGRMRNVSDASLPVVQSTKGRSVVKFVPTEEDVTFVIGSLQECSITGSTSDDELTPTSPRPARRASANSPTSLSLPDEVIPNRVPRRTSSILSALSSSQKEVKKSKLKSFATSPERSSTAAINADDLIGSTSGDLHTVTMSPPGSPPEPVSPSCSRSSASSPQPTSPTSTTVEEPRSMTSRPRLLFQVDQVGGWPGKITSPSGVALLPNSQVLVAECENRLQVFDRDANSIKIIGWGKIKPQGVAITRGKIAVTDKKDRCVKVFSTDGECLLVFGVGVLSMPSGIAAQSSGNLVVTDVDKHAISIWNEGTLLRQFGSWGNDDYQFHNPAYVTVDGFDNIIVSDSCNSCIKIFDQTGTFLRKFSLVTDKQGQMRRPQGVVVHRHGSIIVADRDNHRVTMFSAEGQFERHVLTKRDGIKYPCDLSINDLDQLAVVETHSGFLTKEPHHAVKLIQL